MNIHDHIKDGLKAAMVDDIATIGERVVYTPRDGNPKAITAIVELFSEDEQMGDDHSHDVARGLAKIIISDIGQMPEKGDGLQTSRNNVKNDFSVLKVLYSSSTMAAVSIGSSVRARAVSRGDEADRFRSSEGRLK